MFRKPIFYPYFCAKIEGSSFFQKPMFKVFNFNQLKATLLAVAFVMGFASFAQEAPEAHATGEAHGAESHKSEFSPGDFIMHHIADAHEIHFFTLNEGEANEKEVSIYLPIIVKTEDGWKFFSSSHFYHNAKSIEVKGKHEHYYYDETHHLAMFHEKIYSCADGNLILDAEGHPNHEMHHEAFDMSITKSVLGVLLVATLVFLVFTAVARGYSKNRNAAPKGIQSLLEPMVLFIRDEVAKPSIGKHYEKFTPLLLSMFFFIWFCNMLGLIPFLGAFNITGTMGVTLVLAAIVFVLTTIHANKHFWGHTLWPHGVPFPVKLILVPIEILGIFIRPFVLMVRLTANITAGHIIILSFVTLIFIFGQKSAGAGYGIGVGSLAFMIFMNFIELLVAFLQAYVFTLLTALYFGSVTEEPHHH